MRSSTSNSNQRLPDGPVMKTWLLGLALVVAVAGSWELFLRARGFRPSVSDDAGLWALQRQRVPKYDPQALVLIGASRSQLGLDPQVLGRALHTELGGRDPIQLSILGSSPLPMLEHFAEDESFQGVLVCDVKEIIFFNGSPERRQISRDYLDHYRRLEWFGFAQLKLRSLWQQLLVCPNQEINFQAYRGLSRGQLPVPYQRVRRDRCWEMHFPNFAALAKEQRRLVAVALELGQPMGPARLGRFLAKMAEAVARIQGRGGRVVFVRMPSSGANRQVEQLRVPRHRYWDRLAETGALCIHCDDHPTLAGFECPDGSHLDHADAVRFSEALAAICAEKVFGFCLGQ